MCTFTVSSKIAADKKDYKTARENAVVSKNFSLSGIVTGIITIMLFLVIYISETVS